MDYGTCSLGQQLVAHADAHAGLHVLTLQERADMRHGRLTQVWVARAVGKEESVKIECIEIIVPGHAHHIHPPFQQAAQDIGLYAAAETVRQNDHIIVAALLNHLYSVAAKLFAEFVDALIADVGT